MFKRLIGAVVTTAVAALGVKVVKDILDADEEEKKLIELETEETEEENNIEEERRKSLLFKMR